MIRDGLKPGPIDEELLQRLTGLGERIIEAMDAGLACDEPLAEFNRLAGCMYGPADFHGAAGAMSMSEFVRLALTTEPVRRTDMTRNDFLEIIRLLSFEAGAELNEVERAYWIRLLALHIPNPRIADLLYHSPQLTSPEQILDETLRYRPFAMPPPHGDDQSE